MCGVSAPRNVAIRELETVGEISLAFDLFNEIWGGDAWGAMPVNVLKAMAHARNYVAGAWEGERLVGASAAFAWGDLSARSLHSHISGVLEDRQGRGIGHRLKLHQRAWAAEHGYERITWTFDPLVRRNAWFNLTKLAVRLEEYQPDFYGPMNDGINAGDPTDRCLAVWDVTPRDAGVTRGDTPATPVLVCGNGDAPEVREPRWAESRAMTCQIPPDILAIRQSDPAVALKWREALRSTMGEAMEAGFVATTFTRDGLYILERETL